MSDAREALVALIRSAGEVGDELTFECDCENCVKVAGRIADAIRAAGWTPPTVKQSVEDAVAASTGPVCAWCPTPARGSAWHNDGRLHPSCGETYHGQGWVPGGAARYDVPNPYRAVVRPSGREGS